MNRQELERLRKSIEEFIAGDEAVLEFEVQDPDIPPEAYYHKAISGRPLKSFFTVLIMSFCTLLPSSEFKNRLYRLLGMKIGKGASISAGALFDFGYPELITIKDRAIIGTGVKILTHLLTIRRIIIGRITIGEKALIGVRAVLKPGVAVGDGAVAAIGSVVHRDVENLELVGGVPVKRIKMLDGPL